MYTIKVDQPLTRRKTLHHVMDPEGGLVYSAGKIGPCIAWLNMRQERQFYLVVENGALYPEFLVTITPLTVQMSETAPNDDTLHGQENRP